MQTQNDGLIDVLALLYKKSRSIIFTCLATGLIAAGLSLTLANYYEASTQFYAASPDLAQPNPIGNLPDAKRIYGNDYDVDRLISISKSNTLKNHIIDSFDLYKHYDIDSTKSKAKYKLLQKLDKLYNTTKTKYDAINLSFEDKDPVLAANMANAARVKIDALAQEMIKESQSKLISRYESNVKDKEKQYNAISDSLDFTRKEYKIFNTQSQGEAFGTSIVELEGAIQNYTARVKVLKASEDVKKDSLAITEAMLAGFRSQYANLKESINDYNSGYTDILRYERMLKDFGDQLNIDKERLKQLKAAYSSQVSAIHVVEKAEVPPHKSRPKRSYIVLGVMILTGVLMGFWFVLRDQFAKNNWKRHFDNA